MDIGPVTLPSEDERWDYLLALDDELLTGGVLLSEWAVFMVREADTAFARGANLAAILTAVAAIETHLRSEYHVKPSRLYDLIEAADLSENLRKKLHRLRTVRNRWVHVETPSDDAEVLSEPEKVEKGLETEAIAAARALRQVLYHDQWV